MRGHLKNNHNPLEKSLVATKAKQKTQENFTERRIETVIKRTWFAKFLVEEYGSSGVQSCTKNGTLDN